MLRDDIIIKNVCDYTRIPYERILSKSRMRTICEARQIISYLLQLYTKLTLYKIADLCGYKSHASPIRDRSLVPMFLETDKKYKVDYEPLISEVAELHEQFLQESKSPNTEVLLAGDICWFWNESMPLPILEIFKSFQIDYQNRIWFRTMDDDKPDFPFCKYAGSKVFPADFERPLKADGMEKDQDQDPEIFYGESLIAPISKSTTALELKEPCTI